MTNQIRRILRAQKLKISRGVVYPDISQIVKNCGKRINKDKANRDIIVYRIKKGIIEE